jgi:hypothetical protein
MRSSLGNSCVACRPVETPAGLPRMKLLDVVDRVRALVDDTPYAVIGGLAQILWARKTHTDDLDIAVAASDLVRAYDKVRLRHARGWRLPSPPDKAHEHDAVFEVYPLLFRGSVVDLISFREESLTTEILKTAQPVAELKGARFIRPELLLVTQLLRPGAMAALAAVELVLARRAARDFDLPYTKRWAKLVGRSEHLQRTLARADELER